MTNEPKTLRSIDDLVAAGLIPGADAAALAEVATRYAVAVTPAMAGLVAPDAPTDPIRLQFLPDARELETRPGETNDPIGDHVHEKLPGLVHRYPDRVLLKLTHACPVYCRFCFRREMVGPGGAPPLAGDALDRALAYIAADPAIFEVILTGGDPLVLSPRRVAEITRRLDAIGHVQVLRWHSRVPVVEPDRVTPELIDALRAPRATVYVSIHTNHARELAAPARAAIARLRDAGLLLVSQTVLLKNVNDDAGVLADLFRTLVALGVKPYYLHHADLAPGTAHFRTSLQEGQRIMQQLRGRITGLALPTYVLDIPGGFGKVPVGPQHVTPDGEIIDIDGRRHRYDAAGTFDPKGD